MNSEDLVGKTLKEKAGLMLINNGVPTVLLVGILCAIGYATMQVPSLIDKSLLTIKDGYMDIAVENASAQVKVAERRLKEAEAYRDTVEKSLAQFAEDRTILREYLRKSLEGNGRPLYRGDPQNPD